MTSRGAILSAVSDYAVGLYAPVVFEPGVTPVHYSKEIFDHNELTNLVDAALSGHLTAGKWTQEFERSIVRFFGARAAILVNSGSSANLLMIATICSPNLPDHLVAGDRVGMPALGFPTTLAPVVQHGLVPVFVDVDLDTYNPSMATIERAVQLNSPKAIFLPHPLGLPFAADKVSQLAKEHGLWFIEDGCDSLGATVGGRLVGTFGAMSSLSHYPAHHITGGEGGTVIINSPKVAVIARSLSEWGRSCYCLPGEQNTCGKRFEWDFSPGLPLGTDHKYCVPGDTLIETRDGLIPARRLVNEVWYAATYLDSKAIGWRRSRSIHAGHMGIKSIELQNGMSLRYGNNHPVLTKRGYVAAEELSIQDEVAVVGQLPDRPDLQGLSDDLISIIGMLIADGSYVPRDRYVNHPIQWYKSDKDSRNLFMSSLDRLGVKFTVTSNQYIRPTGNKLHHLLESVGWKLAHASEKRIPDKLSAMSSRQASVLIRALWSGDGMAKVKSTGDTVRIVYASRSIMLCHDIQRILFCVGILSTVTSSSVKYRGNRRPYHFVTVVGNTSKKKMLELLVDTPRIARDVAGALQYLKLRTSMGMQKAYSLDGSIWWVRVKQLSTGNEMEPVFDISVYSLEHNFVADGVITHNCYENIGYNLKATDMQAAVLCAQVDKIEMIVSKRRENFWHLYNLLLDMNLDGAFILPRVIEGAEPSPYAFPIICREGIDRTKVIAYLEAAKIETRPIFGGNLLRQPAFRNIKHYVHSDLQNTDRIMRDGFFVGVHPGLGNVEMEYVAEKIQEAVR